MYSNKLLSLRKRVLNWVITITGSVLKWIPLIAKNCPEMDPFHCRELCVRTYSSHCWHSRNGPFKLSGTMLKLVLLPGTVSKWILPSPSNSYLETDSFHCQELSWNGSFSIPGIVLKWIFPTAPTSDLNTQRYERAGCVTKEAVLEWT